ncbi:unnamed protein product [Rotaria magnacalcarata]
MFTRFTKEKKPRFNHGYFYTTQLKFNLLCLLLKLYYLPVTNQSYTSNIAANAHLELTLKGILNEHIKFLPIKICFSIN